jgi:esterase/lipase superfamily enzyme
MKCTKCKSKTIAPAEYCPQCNSSLRTAYIKKLRNILRRRISKKIRALSPGHDSLTIKCTACNTGYSCLPVEKVRCPACGHQENVSFILSCPTCFNYSAFYHVPKKHKKKHYGSIGICSICQSEYVHCPYCEFVDTTDHLSEKCPLCQYPHEENIKQTTGAVGTAVVAGAAVLGSVAGLAITTKACLISKFKTADKTEDIPTRDKNKFALVRVYFATDRRRKGKTSPSEYYGHEWGSLEYGACTVSVPAVHKRGNAETPKWYLFEFSECEYKHVMIQDIHILEQGDFYGEINKIDSNDAFVFIHGFNQDFAKAARRTAQIAYDLDYHGAPIFYSWPSTGSVGIIGIRDYEADEESIEYSEEHFIIFLKDLITKTDAKKIHLIAHSMGNRLLTRALRSLIRQSDIKSRLPVFNQIILAAPDIDARLFEKVIAPRIKGVSERITLYASSNDKALAASRNLRKNISPRAGESGKDLVILDGIDTIDSSEIRTDLLGHGYFSSTVQVLDDLKSLIKKGLSPDKRSLEEKRKNKQTYWIIPQEKRIVT